MATGNCKGTARPVRRHIGVATDPGLTRHLGSQSRLDDGAGAGLLGTFFLILIATGFAWTSGKLYKTLTDGVGNVIVPVVSNTNNSVDDLYGDIDKSLAVMNLALGSIEAVQVSGGTGDKGSGTAGEVGSAKTRNLMATIYNEFAV